MSQILSIFVRTKKTNYKLDLEHTIPPHNAFRSSQVFKWLQHQSLARVNSSFSAQYGLSAPNAVEANRKKICKKYDRIF